MTTAREEQIRILRELGGVKCFCGKKKTANQSFCVGHYIALPVEMKRAMYKRVGEGYEAAYADARQFFDEQEVKK